MDKDCGSDDFERVLLEAVDTAFSALGEDAKAIIYSCLEQQLLITRRDIPSRLDDFSDALEKIFGLGARYLEILIMKNLHNHVGYLLENNVTKCESTLSFKSYVELVRRSWDSTSIVDLETFVDTDIEVSEVASAESIRKYKRRIG